VNTVQPAPETTEPQPRDCFICGGTGVVTLTDPRGNEVRFDCPACKHGRPRAEAPSALPHIAFTDPLWRRLAASREKNLAALPALRDQLQAWRERKHEAIAMAHAAWERLSLLRALLSPDDEAILDDAVAQHQAAADYERVTREVAEDARLMLRHTLDRLTQLEQAMGISQESDLDPYRELLKEVEYGY